MSEKKKPFKIQHLRNPTILVLIGIFFLIIHYTTIELRWRMKFIVYKKSPLSQNGQIIFWFKIVESKKKIVIAYNQTCHIYSNEYKIFHVHQEAFTERAFQRNLVLFRSNSLVSFLDFIFWAKNDKLHPSRLAKTVH